MNHGLLYILTQWIHYALRRIYKVKSFDLPQNFHFFSIFFPLSHSTMLMLRLAEKFSKQYFAFFSAPVPNFGTKWVSL